MQISLDLTTSAVKVLETVDEVLDTHLKRKVKIQ